jgi:hypothetical protein
MSIFVREHGTIFTRRRWPVSRLARLAASVLLPMVFSGGAPAQTIVVTQHNDISRSGANVGETILTPANVNTATFGKIFTFPVDGRIYAQPLYLPGLTMGAGTPQAGSKHNVVFVATEHDSIYAFDADTSTGANGNPLWQITLLDAAHGAASGATSVPNGDVSTGDIVPEIGITGTPVIDTATNTMYVVGKTLEGANFMQRLHALDITTGLEKFSGPVVLSGQVPGTGNGSAGGVLNWDPKWENQRPGLLLLNGIVYIGYAAHGDNGPWHGWILAYRAANLTQTGAWCTSPNGLGAGVWMSGAGLAADVPSGTPYGRMFVATGNGDYTATKPYGGNMDYGDSIVRLDLTNGVPTVSDEFTPSNQANLNGADEDVAAGGVLLLPDQSGGTTHELVQVGKEGKIYVQNRDALGGYNTGGDTFIQEISGQTGGLWSMPAYWNNNVYFWGSGNNLKSFTVSAGKLATTPTVDSGVNSGFPGATPAISANGTSNGIVWGLRTDAYNSSGPAILYAFDATNVATQLYNSSQSSCGRDTAGAAVKFVVPTVTNGKVYIGAAGELDVYGLLNGMTQTATPVIAPGSETFAGSISVTISDSTPGATIYYTLDGSTPTTASQIYSGPFTVATSETVKAVAALAGSLQCGVASQTYTLETQTATPTFSPVAGSYTTAQAVTISDTSAGAKIYYTTDGSTPTTSSAVFSTPISVAATTTIKALATSSGLSNSPVASALYTITAGGTGVDYSNGFSTATSTMTFNGSTDLDDTRLQLTNGGGNEAGSAFVNTPINIQAFTTDFAMQLSNPAGDGMTFTIQGNSPTALGPPGGGLGYGPDTPGGTPGILKSVAVKFDLYSNAGEGVDSTGLYLNGVSPTTPSTDLTSSGIDLHSGDTMSVHMKYDGTILALTITDAVAGKTFATSWPVNIPSTVGSNTAYIGFTGGTGGATSSQKVETWTFVSTGSIQPTVATPAFSLAAGTYLGTQTLTITDATAGATIYYTTNGTTPTTSSNRYTAPLAVNVSETIEAIAVASGFQNSVVTSAAYVIESQVATPTFSPVAGSYTSAQAVTISDASAGAKIYYTTNGSTPTTSSALYAAPISVSTTETVKAIAAASGFFSSNVASASYTITAPTAATPVISPATGTYTTAQTVTITDSTAGAAIHYTTNGSAPTASSTTYTGAFTVSSTLTVHAMAIAAGFTSSAVATATYTITPPAATPVISPGTGTYASAQSVTITDTTTGAAIHYTTDGSAPTASSTTYTAAFTVSSTATVHAIAVASGFSTSAVAAATLTIQTSGGAISFGSGFTGTGLAFNGSAAINGTRLRLTDTGGNEAGSAWFTTPENIQKFTTDFTFQLTTPNADGFAFVVQNTGTTALGPSGGGLGYGPDNVTGAPGSTNTAIARSVALKFDLYNNAGEGTNSTGVYLNGASPTTPFTALGGGVNLHSGDTMKAHVTYDGTNLVLTITDTVTTAQTFTASFPVNIPAAVGANTAYLGFTGGTGGATAVQEITTWTYSNTVTATKTPVVLATTSLPAVSSGPTFRVFAYGGFPDGNGTILDATKVGDNVAFTVNIAAAGTYDVKVSYKAYNTRGIWQLAVNGANLGAATDEFLAGGGDALVTADLGTMSFPAAGNYAFKFTVTGHNSGSSSYSISFDDFTLTPQ